MDNVQNGIPVTDLEYYKIFFQVSDLFLYTIITLEYSYIFFVHVQ